MPLKQAEGRARGAAKTVDGLVGIAHGEDVPFFSGQGRKDLDLGEVRVLELVNEMKRARLCSRASNSESCRKSSYERVIMWLNVPSSRGAACVRPW